MLPDDGEKPDQPERPALSDGDLTWADYVFISAMTVQKESVYKVMVRCRQMGVKTVAGGPLLPPPADFEEVNPLVLGEAEITLRPFLEDLESGEARHL